jgi:ubiquitin carboxyl-terminal hydrolase 34
MNGADENRNRLSVESESDVISTVPAVETPSSSASAGGSPQIELVVEQDDTDFGDRSPQVAIIGEDDIFGDPVQSFPFLHDGESLVAAIKRLVHYVQYGMYSSLGTCAVY